MGHSGLIAIAALLLPALIFGAILIGLIAWETGQTALRIAQADAQRIVDRIDAELRHDIRALTAVAGRIKGAPITQSRPAPGTTAFNAELFPQWKGSLIWSLDTKTTVFSSLPGEGLPAPSPSWAERVRSSTGPVIGGIEPVDGEPVILVHVQVPDDARKLVLTTALLPDRFQDILMSRAPQSGVSAIVDRTGKFIARSFDFSNRVGKPASLYVRQAAERGGRGAYLGRTLEGIDNHSVYETSTYSGWSVHFAISQSSIQGAVPWTAWVAISGGLLSVVVAAGLVWLIQRDGRRRQQAERAMANARRVETLGRLTGGIAHDFNNLLTVIIGSLERGQKRSADASTTREMGLALEAARRAAGLTRSLLLYSRQQSPAAEVVRVNTCITEAADVIRRTVGAQYDVATRLEDDAIDIRADTAQLASALLNLAINARDAMPAGGNIEISLRRRHIAKADNETGLNEGDYAEITVADNGPGMPPDIARRAFDPFFTTKDVGKGTGLGLAQVDAFARQYGGLAELETLPGRGVRVSIIIPITQQPAEMTTGVAPAKVPQRLAVLVVEDEAGVREHAAALLRDFSCEVVTCSDAACAYGELKRKRFDLLFSDIVLPNGESGVRIAEYVEEHHPQTAIVLATGYSGDELKGKEGRWQLLLKPYGPADLSAAIAAALRHHSLPP